MSDFEGIIIYKYPHPIYESACCEYFYLMFYLFLTIKLIILSQVGYMCTCTCEGTARVVYFM